MTSLPWTEEELKILKTLAREGHGMETMLAVLQSRSKDGISKAIRRYNITFKTDAPKIDYDLLNQIIKDIEI